jgi:alanine racemase
MSIAESEPQQDLAAPEVPVAETALTFGPPAEQAGGILTIDLAAIEANWLALSRRAMPSECAAVIKADGYGCGSVTRFSSLAREDHLPGRLG